MNYSIKNLQGRFVLFCGESAVGVLPPSNAPTIHAMALNAAERHGERARDWFLAGVIQALCGAATGGGVVAVEDDDLEALTAPPARGAFLRPGIAPPPPPWPVTAGS